MIKENINRKELLQKYMRLLNQKDEYLWNNLNEELVEFPEDVDYIQEYASKENQIEAISEEILRLRNSYLESLPQLGISRCPFTGQILNYCLDNEGLDGLWWNLYDPVRRDPLNLSTVLAITGAMKLNQPLEHTDCPVEVGPEIPYVLPALLGEEGILAVLSSCKVGNHTAYVIVYYSNDPSSVVLRPNEWGTDRYFYQDEKGEIFFSQADDIMEIKDFELIPWMEAGKLLWILPEDKALNLRADVNQSPFIGLRGNQNIQIIQNGELIELETDEELDNEVEETLSSLEIEEDEDLTPIPDELWKLLPQEGGTNE